MVLDLSGQISQLKKEKWVNLQGLVDCSITYRSINGSRAAPICQSIAFLGDGSYNTAYQLVFDDGIQLAASISKIREEDFDAQAKLSEIETMRFVHESGLYPDIPVPKVHTWDTAFSNPVGAPYVLMDVVQGETMDDFNSLPHTQQLSIVKTLAKLKASLSKPVPFNKLGSITSDSAGGFSLGPLMTCSQRCLGGPFESVPELWQSCLEDGIHYAVEEWCLLTKDEIPGPFEPKCAPLTFVEVFQQLSALIPHFKIPEAYNTLVLHHPDIAFRNILFDKDSLQISSDHPKITGVLDWAGAQILPLMLTAHNIDDLMTSLYSPFLHAGLPHEHWMSVPYDWTFAGNSTQWPKAIRSTGEPYDYTPGVTEAVRRFYFRAYFSACYAEQLHLLGDNALPHATLFADAPYYLKFHETVCGGWEQWIEHGNWIRETYWRLRTLTAQTPGKELLITGPNVYRGSMEVAVCDLGMPGDDVVDVEDFHNS